MVYLTLPLDIVKYFINEKNIDLNIADKSNRTPLHFAAKSGHLDAVKYFIDEKNVSLNIADRYGSTPLLLAAENGYLGVVKYFIDEKNANFTVIDKDGRTSLYLAAKNGYLDVVKYLIDEKGADFKVVNNYGSTSLHGAAKNGHLEIVKYLIDEKDADFNVRDMCDRLPLHSAAGNGELNIIKYLIDQKKADHESLDGYGDIPLNLAAENGHLDTVKYLINKQGSNVKFTDIEPIDCFGNTPLSLAAENGHLDTVKYLINEKGINFEIINDYERTPLCEAAKNGHLEVVKYLINEKGADFRFINDYGDTPLHVSASFGKLDVVKLLVEKGAHVNDKNMRGDAPIHLAAYWGWWDVVRFLIEKEADVNVKNCIGKTPMHLASEAGRLDIVKYLVGKGANVKDYGVDLAKEHNNPSVTKSPSHHEQSECIIQSTHSNKKQQGAFLHSAFNADIRPIKQGLYLPSFEERGVEFNGKCVAITRGLSQALLSQSDKSFLSNLETSAKIYERIVRGKQVSKREERGVFAFSELLNNFERQLDSAASSLPSSLIHNKDYETLDDLSNYIAGIKGDFAIHLVTSNHVVAVYRTSDNYAYFDSNTAFVSGLKSVDQLMQIVEKGVESAGYKVEEKGFLVEHFDVARANNQLPDEDKQVLTKEIKTERHLLAEQDKEFGLIKINGRELSRAQLYDFGTKVNVEGSVPLLINAEMNLNSKKFQAHLDKREVSMTAREYFNQLKGSKNVEEVVRATKAIPFIGSKREIEEVEQIRKPKQPLLEQLVKGAVNFIASNLTTAFFASVSRSESQLPGKTDDKPKTFLNNPTVDNQLQKSL